MLLRRAGGSLLRNPCPPSGPLEGWGPQAKRSGRDGAKRKVSGGRAAVRPAEEWTSAQRDSSRPPGGRVDIRSAEEQPSARRKSGHTFSERAAVRPEEVLPTQRARLSAGRMRTRVRTRVQTWAQASWCRPGCESGCGPRRGPAGAGRTTDPGCTFGAPGPDFWLATFEPTDVCIESCD